MLVAVGIISVRHHIAISRRSHTLNRHWPPAPRINSGDKSARGKCGECCRFRADPGEALLGLVWAGCVLSPSWGRRIIPHKSSAILLTCRGMIVLAVWRIDDFLAGSAAGDPNEPAPPTAMM